MHEGFWSLVPPLVAIVLAILTRQVYVSLLIGIFLGWVVLTDGNLLQGALATIEALVEVFQDAGNARTILFAALVGSLIVFIQRSGGVAGFIRWIDHLLVHFERQRAGRNRVVIQLLAWLTGLLIFVESSISVLTVGALYRPVFDRLKISREKLAYLADSSSAPSSILLPFNAWGAFIMGLLVKEGFDDPFAVLFTSMKYNFYPILAILLALGLILWGKDFGPMAKAERRVRGGGPLLRPGATPLVAAELTEVAPKAGVPPRAFNMLVPIGTMVAMMPVMLAYTGWAEALANRPAADFFGRFFYAIGQGSGSTAVLVAVVTALFVSAVLYRVQGIFRLRELTDLTLQGIAGLMPLALLMLFAFAINAVCKQLGTGLYVAEVTQAWLSPALVPALVFLISCFIAFSTGTSWGTFGIMMAIAVPMATQLNADPYMAIAAVMGGGVFGDHCSPISDTTILSSMASATDHIDHVQTQLPYALLAGGGATLLYLLLGFLA